MKHIIAGLLILLITSTSAAAKTLNFKGILELAIKNSYDLQISEIDIGISEAGVKEARSEYYPAINLGYNAGYDRDLSDGGSTVTPVGDSVILNNTRYQSSASVGLQHNLFDFGIKGKKLKIAKKDRTQKKTSYSINLRDLKLEIADIYTRALLNYKEYTTNRELLALNTELFSMQERLYGAGRNPKTDVIEQALKVARIINKIDEIRTEFLKVLEELSFYTGEIYDIEGLLIEYMNKPGIEYVNLEKQVTQTKDLAGINGTKFEIEAVKTDFLDTENLPEYKYYQLEIEKKQAELAILNRQRLPHFRFYTNYYLYGADRNDYWATFADFEDTNLSFRISSSLPVFSGFKNTAQRERARLEIERLKKQRDKKVEEIKSFYQKMYRQTRNFDSVLLNQEKSLELVQQKISMLDRMSEQKLIDKISYLTQKGDLVSQKLELEHSKINNEANVYKLNILKQTSGEELCKQD